VTFAGNGGAKRWLGDVPSLRVSTNASEYPFEFKAAAAGGTLTGQAPTVRL
jgi:hypothetical protein